MESEVKHLITIKHRDLQISFEFESYDIGCTQGTTLSLGDTLLVQYRPGTSHWDRALEIAQEVLVRAVKIALDEEAGLSALSLRRAAVKAVEQQQYARLWNGEEPEPLPVDWDEVGEALGVEVPKDRRV